MSAVVKSGEGVASNLEVILHPLPLLNISDHFTRVALQHNDASTRVVGGLLGTQEGRRVEILNSFELVIESPATDTEDECQIDLEHLRERSGLYKQVFPTFDFLGWYSIGSAPTQQDLAIHRQFIEINESPLFLQMQLAKQAKELPVSIYESHIEILDNAPNLMFIKAAYEMETGEAERIAVDHVSKPSSATQDSSSGIIANLTTQRNAIARLEDRVSVIATYLDAVSKGQLAPDHETLRQISALVTSLPAPKSKEFEQEFLTEYNDVLLTTYLASLTKQLEQANMLLDKKLIMTADKERGPGGQRKGGAGAGRSRDFFRE